MKFKRIFNLYLLRALQLMISAYLFSLVVTYPFSDEKGLVLPSAIIALPLAMWGALVLLTVAEYIHVRPYIRTAYLAVASLMFVIMSQDGGMHYVNATVFLFGAINVVITIVSLVLAKRQLERRRKMTEQFNQCAPQGEQEETPCVDERKISSAETHEGTVAPSDEERSAIVAEFKTTLNRQTTLQLNKQSFKSIWWVFLILSLALLSAGICDILQKQLDIGIFLVVLGVLFIPLVWLLTMFAQSRMDKSASYISDQTEEVYVFDGETVLFEQRKLTEFESATRAKYRYFYTVKETATHYFMYISRMQCHVIPKNSLTSGSIDGLNQVLTHNLGNKFKPCKNRK